MVRRFLHLFLILTSVGLSILYVKGVLATGGAYNYTKHGGGTVDGIGFEGVNRGVNPDYGGQYFNDPELEAGVYQPGECNHCHEPHASFGGSEPPPVDAGPYVYLLMKDYGTSTNYSELCWYCHENQSPNGNQGSGYWNFYQGKERYQNSSHYNSQNFAWPGTTGDPVTIWPRKDRRGLPSGNKGSCLNCHTPHGIKEKPGYEFDTTAVPATKHTAAENPDVSTDYVIPRQLIAWEEALCENCHNGTVASTNIKAQINRLAYGSGHPVHDTNEIGGNTGTFSGRHSLKNEYSPAQGWNAYGDGTRHVECVDCHNPHVARAGTVFQRSGTTTWNPNRVSDSGGVYAGGVNKGVWGVSVDTTTGDITGRVEDTSLPGDSHSSLYLYQICLKCHSTYADPNLTVKEPPSYQNRSRWPGDYFDAGTGDQPYLSDVAKDFAIENGGSPPKGYHPVFGWGRNQPDPGANFRWTMYKTPNPCPSPCPEGINRETGKRADLPTNDLSNNFVPPWGQDSLVTCVDCHEDSEDSDETTPSPRGPHGSSRPYILRKLDNTITYKVYNADGTPYTVSYNNFYYGYTSNTTNGTDGFIGGQIDLGSQDPNNLCLNCHRADVYGFLNQGEAIPRYRYLSRQPHPADWANDLSGGGGGGCGMGGMGCGAKGESFVTTVNAAGNPPRGIVCLRCHGGGTIGGIHGNSGAPNYTYDTSNITPTSNRLLNGTAWNGVRFSSTTSQGYCFKNAGNSLFNSCTHMRGGDMGFAMYDY